MLLHIQTQYRENYGAHDWDGNGSCPQYWKNKGGDDYLVDLNGIAKSLNDRADVEAIVKQMSYKIESFSNFSEEYIISWGLVEDNYVTDYEKSQLKFDGEILYPATRLTLDSVEV